MRNATTSAILRLSRQSVRRLDLLSAAQTEAYILCWISKMALAISMKTEIKLLNLHVLPGRTLLLAGLSRLDSRWASEAGAGTSAVKHTESAGSKLLHRESATAFLICLRVQCLAFGCYEYCSRGLHMFPLWCQLQNWWWRLLLDYGEIMISCVALSASSHAEFFQTIFR